MSRARANDSGRVLRVAVVLLAVALVGALVYAVVNRGREHTVTVDFDRTVSLYEGSKVRILGVDVGTVEKLTPMGTKVRATLTWDADVKVPADVQAVVVSPSVVGDRFVQLTPAYTSGATLRTGTHLDQTRTAVPTELDDTFEQLDRVSKLLGPEGVNRDGTLSTTLSNSAKNLDGKGAQIRESIAQLARVTQTADGSKDSMFASVEKLAQFTESLEKNDASVRSFNVSLARVSDVLADESGDLQAAVGELAVALQQVQTFVSDNRTLLRRNVDTLNTVTGSLATQRSELAKILQNGPKALSNLSTTYNPATGAIDTRGWTEGDIPGELSAFTEAFSVNSWCTSVSRLEDPSLRGSCAAAQVIAGHLIAVAPSSGSSRSASDLAEVMEVP